MENEIKPGEFRCVLKNVESLKILVNSLNALCNEIKINATPEGLKSASMDAANVAMILFEWQPEDFLKYEVGKGGVEFCINTSDLKQCLRRMKGGMLEIQITDGMKMIYEEGGRKKTYKFGLISMDEKTSNIPNLDFKFKSVMPSQMFSESMDEGKEVGEGMQIIKDGKKIVFYTVNDIKELRTELTHGEQGVEVIQNDLEVSDGKSKSRYSTEYLSKMTEPGKKTEKVTLEWSKDYPCRIAYELENLKIWYILAPRVDND